MGKLLISLQLFADSWGQIQFDMPQAGSDKCKREMCFRVAKSGQILPLSILSLVSNSSSSVKPAGFNLPFCCQQLILFSPTLETTQWNFICIWIQKKKTYKSVLPCLKFLFVIFSPILCPLVPLTGIKKKKKKRREKGERMDFLVQHRNPWVSTIFKRKSNNNPKTFSQRVNLKRKETFMRKE